MNNSQIRNTRKLTSVLAALTLLSMIGACATPGATSMTTPGHQCVLGVASTTVVKRDAFQDPVDNLIATALEKQGGWSCSET